MPLYALDTVLLGRDAPVERGDAIPDTFTDYAGKEQPVDGERLIELGVAAKTKPKADPAE